MSDRVETITFRTRRQIDDERRVRREAGLARPAPPALRASRPASSTTAPTWPATVASPAPA